MQEFGRVLARLRDVLTFPLGSLGGSTLSLGTLLYFGMLTILLFLVVAQLRRWLERILARGGVDIGVRQAAGSIFRYVLLLLGLLVILQAAGLDLSVLAVVAGALGVGVGFGLQAITSNFVSGLIILFERPIKVGDRVEVGSVVGNVVRISGRATTLLTNDNIAVIVPNAEFVTSRVVNWSYTDRDVRFDIPVGVAYGSDSAVVQRLLRDVAAQHPGVLRTPAPDVLLAEFGESSLNFVLRVWTREYTVRPGVLRSELNFAILEAFRSHGVQIPFPQRDVHLHGAPAAASA